MLEFLKQWDEEYSKAKFILKYLQTYPEILSKLRLNDICFPDDLDPAQEEWVRLYSKFTHPIEKDFFKPYFVPIIVNSLDYFIDISSKSFPIFKVHFMFYKPYTWYKEFIIEDIKPILLAQDEGTDLNAVIRKNMTNRWNWVSNFFRERLNLVFEGKLEVEQVTLAEIISNSDSSNNITKKLKENSVVISGVTSVIVGLLPYSMKVMLRKIEYNYLHDNRFKDLDRVKNIRDLLYVCRHTGLSTIERYDVDIHNYNNSIIKFDHDIFTLICEDENVLDDFLLKLSALQKDKDK